MKNSEFFVTNLSPLAIFAILYLPIAISITTGIGLEIGPLLVGLFPYLFVYFYWLLILARLVKQKLPLTHAKVFNITSVVKWISVSMYILIPLYWVMVNYLFHNRASTITAVLTTPIAFLLIICLFVSWRSLSKSIYSLTNKSSYSVGFKDYGILFILFVLGPLTIWFLQPRIKFLKRL